MLNLKFKNYPSGSWEDWNPNGQLSSLGTIKRGVESSNPGEAGLIKYDKVNTKFYYTPGTNAYTKFSGDLDSINRYMFRIEGVKTNGTPVQVFEGVANLTSISEPDLGRLINFDVLDKLSALDIIEDETYRTEHSWTLTAGIGDDRRYIKVTCPNTPESHWLYFYDILSEHDGNNWVEYPQPFPERFLVPGNIVKIPDGDSYKYAVIVTSEIVTFPEHRLQCKIVSVDIEKNTTLLGAVNDVDTISYLSRNYGGIDIGNYTGSGTSEELVSYDAFKLIEAIVKSAWVDINIYKVGFVSVAIPLYYYDTLKQFQPLGKHPYNALKYLADSMRCYVYFNRSGHLVIHKRDQIATGGTLRSFVGKTKVSGSKKRFWDKLADGIKIKAVSNLKDDKGEYITAEVIVRKNPNIEPKNLITKEIFVTDPSVLDESQLTAHATSIANEYFNFYGKRHSQYNLNCDLDDDILEWELLDRVSIDGVEYFIEGLDIELIKWKASFSLVSVTGYNYSYSSAHVYQSEQNKISQTAQTTIVATISNTDNYRWDGGGAGLDPVAARTSIGIDVTEPLSYDINSGLIGLKYSDKFSINENGELDFEAASLTFDLPLSLTEGVVSLLYNNTNLKVNVSDELDTIQDIAETSNVTFANITAGGKFQQTGTTQNDFGGDVNIATSKVYKINNVSILSATTLGASVVNSSLTSVGTLTTGVWNATAINGQYINYNTTNLKVTSNQLNTIQDIATTSTPRFQRLGLGKDADVSLSLDTLSGVNVGGDLTVQGNLAVMGTQFIANVETVEIEDNLLLINRNEVGNGVTAGVAGIEVERGTLTNYQFLFNENSDTFRVGEVGSLQAVATREDSPNAGAFTYWNSTAYRLDTLSGYKWNGSQLTLDYNIGTSNYVSQLTGWRISSTGQADFRYIYADELHVKAFIADISQALAGSDFLTKSVALLSRDMTVPSSEVLGTTYLYVEDLPGFPDTQVFQANDWIRLRVVDRSGGGLIVADVWGTVTSYVDLIDGEQRWTFTCRDDGGANGLKVYQGALALDYGTSGNGFIERTVLDPAGSPYTRVVTWTTDPTNSANYSLKMQYGSLDGITHPLFGTLTGYGLYATGNIYIEGVIKALAGGEIAGYTINANTLSTTNAILQGGTSPYFKIQKSSTTDFVNINYTSSSIWGLQGRVGNTNVFQLGSTNQIAGWGFNASQISSSNLNGGSDGAFTTAGIAMNSAGWLSAVNFALGTSISKIANWTFSTTQLYTTNAILQGGSAPYVKVQKHTTEDYVVMHYTNTGSWGFVGRAGNQSIFALGSSNFVGPWTFTSTQLYNGDVRLEGSASFKGIAIKKNINSTDYDLIKIGDFTGDPPDVSVDVSATLLPEGTFNTSGYYTAWTKTDNNKFTWNSSGYSGYCLRSNAFQNVSNYEQTTYITKSVPSDLRGVTVELEFRYKHGTEFTTKQDFALTINDNGGNTLFYQVYSTTNTSWGQKVIKLVIPSSATSLSYYLKFFKTGSNQTCASTFIDEIKLKAYSNVFTYINKNGAQFYSSSLNNFSFLNGVIKMNAYEVLVQNVAPARYQGYFAPGTNPATIENLKAGDIYEIGTDVFMMTANGGRKIYDGGIS